MPKATPTVSAEQATAAQAAGTTSDCAAQPKRGEPEMKQATVMVRFIVTPAPAITFDKEMIHVENAADDHTSVETVAIGNEGEYSLKYTLELDASGIGDTSTEEDGGGVASAFKPAKPAGVDTVAAEAQNSSHRQGRKQRQHIRLPV